MPDPAPPRSPITFFVYFKHGEQEVGAYLLASSPAISRAQAWLYQLEQKPAYAIRVTPREGCSWA